MGQPQQGVGALTQVQQPVGGANPYTTGGQIQPYTPMQQQPMQQQPMQQQAVPPMGSDTRQVQQQPGFGYGNPQMQAYYAQDAANQAIRSQTMQGLGSQPGVVGGNMTTGVYNGPFGANGQPAVSPYQSPSKSSGGLIVGPDGRFIGIGGGDGTFNPFATPWTPNGVSPQLPEQTQQDYNAALLEKERSLSNPYSPPMTQPKPKNVWGSYGFDQPLTDYLNNQAMLSATDAAPYWSYDPATKMFTGATMGGKTQLSLAEMQQRAASQPLINPYGPTAGDRPFTTGVYNGPFGPDGRPTVSPFSGVTEQPLSPSPFSGIKGAPGLTPELLALLTGVNPLKPVMPPSLPTSVNPPMPTSGGFNPPPPGYRPGRNGQPTLAQEIQSLQGMTPGSPAYNQQMQWVRALQGIGQPAKPKPIMPAKPLPAKPLPAKPTLPRSAALANLTSKYRGKM